MTTPPPPPPPPPPGGWSRPTPTPAPAVEADLPTDARILVVDRSLLVSDHLQRRGLAATHLQDPSRLAETVHDQPWDVIVAGPHEADDASLQRLAQLRRERPDIGLIITLNGQDPADLGTFVRARPDDLVRIPLADGEIERALASTLDSVRHRRGIRTQSEQRTVGHAPPTLAKVYAVTGPTGGSGKTMVTLSLAHLLGARGARVIVADMDAQFGEVSAALQLRPRFSAYDVLFDEAGRGYGPRDVAEHLPPALIDAPDGFAVLTAPADPVHADMIGGEQVRSLIEVMRQRCDVLVLDCATGLDERTLAALDMVDHTVVVTQIDVPGIANLKTFLTTADRLGIDAGNRTVVLNKEIPGSGVTGKDVLDVLGPIGGVLPFEPLVTRALNNGRPMTADLPGHEVTTRLTELLAPLLPPPDTDTRTDRRHRLFGRRKA